MGRSRPFLIALGRNVWKDNPHVARTLCDARHIFGCAHWIIFYRHVAAYWRGGKQSRVFRVRAYNGTLYLLTLLIQAIFVLVPQPIHLLGVELCVVNLVGLGLPLSNAYRYFYRNTDVARRSGLMIHRAVTYAAAYLVGVAGGVALVLRSNCGMYLVTASYTALLVAVVLGAWAIMLGIGRTEEAQN